MSLPMPPAFCPILSFRRALATAGQYELVGAAAKDAAIAGSARDYDAFGNRTADKFGARMLNALNQYSAAPGPRRSATT